MAVEIKQEEPKKPRRRIKKAKGHAGHHGGAWKVAYADFVTAMMALFLVLWLVSQADVKIKQAIASYFRSPGVFDSQQGGILTQAKRVSREPTNATSKDDEQALYSVAQSLQKQFANKPDFQKSKDRIKIDVTDEGLRIQVIDKADKVSFASGSAEMADDVKSILSEIAAGICAMPNKINIGGHTDSRTFQSDNGYTNWELSADRANAARRVLEANCVQPDQIHRIIGFADTELMVPNDPYSPANRRISITVLRLAADADANGNAKPDADKTPDKTGSAPAQPAKSAPKIGSLAPKTKTGEAAKKEAKPDGGVVVGEPDEVPGKSKEEKP